MAQSVLELILQAKKQGGDVVKQASSDLAGFVGSVAAASKALLANKDVQRDASGALRTFGVDLDALKNPLTTTAELLKESVTAAANWGDSMGDLAQLTGGTVRETSQMAASLELVGVKTATLEQALKSMTKNGLALNMSSLKDLSRQYQALEDPIARNEFLFKSFGKAGLEMAEIMGKSADELDRLERVAKSSGKVIGEEAAANAEEFNLQMAIFNQRVEGAKIALGNALIPAVLEFINTMERGLTVGAGLSAQLAFLTGQINGEELAARQAAIAQGDLAAGYLRTWQAAQDVTTVTQTVVSTNANAVTSMYDLTTAMMELDDPMAVYREFAPMAYDSAAAARQHRDDVLILATAIDGPLKKADEDFAARQADLTQKAKDYQVEIDNLSGKTYLTDAQREQLDEAKAGLDDTNLALEANAAKHEEASRRIIFSLLQQQAAADGLTQKELEGLLLVAQNWGMIDEKTATATKDISRNLENLANNGDVAAFARNIEIAAGVATGALNSIPRSIDINVNMRGAENLVGVDFGSTGRRAEARAGGGPVSAGRPYWVGELGPELVVPVSSGTVFSASDSRSVASALGGNVYVSVTYAPTMSLGDEVEFETRVIPLIKSKLRL